MGINTSLAPRPNNVAMVCRRLGCALVIAAVFAGCGTPPPAPVEESGAGSAQATGESTRRVHQASEGAPIRLAFVTNNASEFWKIAAKGLEKAEKEIGVKVDFRAPATGKVEEQTRILEDLISQGYHGIAISVLSPEDQVRDLNQAAQKTNVITHDSDAPKSDRLVYIGTNNFEAGKALGQEIVKLLPDGGQIAAFVGTLSADNARQRLEGIKSVVADHKIEVVTTKEDNKDTNKARSNVEDVITAYPDVDVLVGLWSYNGPAIVAAARKQVEEGKVKIACFDEEEATLQGIQDGLIVCTVVQKPFEFGYRSAKLLHELATKGESALPASDVIDTGVDVINSENVADFKEKLAELKK